VVLGYNFFILIAGTGYLLGVTQSKEYAEPEWYADLWLTIVWVTYLLVFLMTLVKRREPHIFVANWFYLAFIVTIAVLHLGNNPAVPVSVFGFKVVHRLGRRSGRDVPVVVRAQRGRILPDRRLSRHHVLLHPEARRAADLFIPAVDHPFLVADISLHLGGSAPPALHGAAGLGPDARHDILDHAVDAVLGGMINGLMTLSGAWDKLRTDPVLRMLVVSVAFYGMATFEGPLMSIKVVNSLVTTPTGPSVTSIPARLAGSGSSRSARSIAWCRGCESQGAVQPQARQLALLDRDHRHRSLHLGDVGVGHFAGLDVARLYLARLP